MAPSPRDRSPSGDKDARKRVAQACDRCRLKKIKCDGNIPCNRCRSEDAVCHFGARRRGGDRPIPSGYIDQLELQQRILVKALKVTWKRYVMEGDPSYTEDVPPVHTIVESLGILGDPSVQFGSQEGFEEDMAQIQSGTSFEDMLFDDSLLSEEPTALSAPIAHSVASSSRSASVATLDVQAGLAAGSIHTSRSSGAASAHASGHVSPQDAPELTRGMQYFNFNMGEAASAPEYVNVQHFSRAQALPPSMSMPQIAGMPMNQPRVQGPPRRQGHGGTGNQISDVNWRAWINEDPR